MTIDVELNEQIAAGATRFLPSRFPIKPTGPLPDPAILRSNWQELVELGWPFVLATEHRGTDGASQIDTIFRAMGINPIVGPTVDMFVALPLVWRAADDTLQELLEPHLAGMRIIAIAHASESANGQVDLDIWDGVTLDGDTLTGTKTLVEGSAIVDDLIVFASEGGEPVIAMVDVSSPRVALSALTSPDRSSNSFMATFSGAKAKVLVRGDRAREVGKAFVTLARLAVVSELVGMSKTALEMTVEYAKLRKQFGRTIGSFQAIKHLLAEAKLLEYSLACVADRLVAELEEGSEMDDGFASAERALCYATRASQGVFDICLQVHGGIGFTLEYTLSWYYNRAASLWGLWGDPNNLALRIAARHGLGSQSLPEVRVSESAS